jgi:hypothetical protein
MNTLLQDGNMFPMVKYTLSHYGYRSYDSARDNIDPSETDITGCEKSSDGLEIKFSRDGLKGVITEESVPQEFVLEAFTFLRDLYGTYGPYAVCRLNIYHRDGINTGGYTHVKSFNLDFGSIRIHDNYVEIEAENTGLNAFVKSAGGTRFDIPVPDIADAQEWRYSRITMTANGSFTLPENYVARYGYNGVYNWVSGCPYLRLDTFKKPPDSAPHEAITMEQFGGGYGYDDYMEDTRGRGLYPAGGGSLWFDSMPYFFEAVEAVDLTVSMKFHFSIITTGDNIDHTRLVLFKNHGRDEVILKDYGVFGLPEISDDIDLAVTVPLIAGDTLSLGFSFRPPAYENTETSVTFTAFERFLLTYEARGKVRNIPVIDPEILLSTLVGKMTDGRYTGASIQWREGMGYIPMLCAAESLRGFEAACVHTSFKNFAGWMRVKGYEYTAGEEGISFLPREDLFTSAVIAEIGEGEASGLVREANTEYAYTSVKIGYDKYEYTDTWNGRAEVNGTFEYLTGLISQKENTLELISPYRGDPVGMELLCWETPQDGKGGNDSRADNDLFEVAMLKVESVTGYIWLVYDRVYTVSGGLKLFNAVISPYHLVKDNAGLFGVVTDTLYFGSTTSARDARYIDGESEEPMYANVPVNREERLFDLLLYNFSTGSHVQIPVDGHANGLVMFRYGGNGYEGYIMEGTRNLTRGTESTFTLMAKQT